MQTLIIINHFSVLSFPFLLLFSPFPNRPPIFWAAQPKIILSQAMMGSSKTTAKAKETTVDIVKVARMMITMVKWVTTSG